MFLKHKTKRGKKLTNLLFIKLINNWLNGWIISITISKDV